MRWWMAMLAATICAGAGCQELMERPPSDAQDVGAIAPSEDGGWPFAPVRLRLHPLTRITDGEQPEDAFIEARLEFLDAWDHTTKAVGQVRLDLYDASRPPGPDSLLARWEHDLRNLQNNADRFDDITQTYLIRLKIPRDRLPRRGLLEATFFSTDGRDLQDSRQMTF